MATTVWAETLTLCYEDIPNPPYYYGTTEIPKQQPGATIDLLQTVAAELAIHLKLYRVPWKRCLSMLKQHQVDGAFDLSYKAERAQYAVYPEHNGVPDKSKRLHENAYFLYSMKGTDINLSDPSKEPPYLLAGVAGYSIVSDLRQKGFNVIEGANQQSNLDMLIRSRVQGVVQIESMTDGIISSHPEAYRDVIKGQQPVQSKSYFLVFSKPFYKNKKELVNQIWNKIALMHQPGQFRQFIKKNQKKKKM